MIHWRKATKVFLQPGKVCFAASTANRNSSTRPNAFHLSDKTKQRFYLRYLWDIGLPRPNLESVRVQNPYTRRYATEFAATEFCHRIPPFAVLTAAKRLFHSLYRWYSRSLHRHLQDGIQIDKQVIQESQLFHVSWNAPRSWWQSLWG
jgi:hypothetical protein